MLTKTTIVLSVALVLGAASAALAMTHKDASGAVIQRASGGHGSALTAAEKAWLDRASQQSNQ